VKAGRARLTEGRNRKKALKWFVFMDFLIFLSELHTLFNMGPITKLTVLIGLTQVISAYTVEDKFEPMVAFICDRPAMHKEVNGWISDDSTDCQQEMPDILAYCQHIYPDQNISNVVEASYLVTINNWPVDKKHSEGSDRKHSHTVRPFRCLVGGFQSDSLLVPQHCVFDHLHDQTLCEGFSHWNIKADEACRKKGTVWHLESFGMLLNCGVGKFAGVEYVCCPNEGETNEQEKPTEDNDKPHVHDDIVPIEGGSESDELKIDLNEELIDFYEAYLRGQKFPEKYDNEHKKFLAAKDTMKKNQQAKNSKLLQQWQDARDHVQEVKKVDSPRAGVLNKEIAERFEKLYASYQGEDNAEKNQLLALHQQHVQAALNEHKRETMDRYMKSLERGDTERITEDLQAYIKSEEKDRMHTVNHFEHVKFSNAKEAKRIQPFIVNHLRLSEQRIDQAMDMLARYPDIEIKVKPEVDEFLRRFAAIANSIKNVVLPEVEVQEDSSVVIDNSSDNNDSDFDLQPVVDEENVKENEHDNEHDFQANAQHDTQSLTQSLDASQASGDMGSTLGVALGGCSVFIIVIVAIFMVKRRSNQQSARRPGPEYAVVEPSASPEEKHLANMQMNGYENPTYKYFEVQNTANA